MTGKIIHFALLMAAVLVIAGIVHIVSLLILPRLAPNDAFARIAAAAPADAVEILPRAAAPGNRTPFRDPALASALCRYDLNAGPLRVTASVNAAAAVALSFHSRYGLPFYGLTDRASNEGKLDILLMTAHQRDQAENADVDGEPQRDVRVVAPHPEGFVEFDALARVGGYAMAEAALGSVSCKVERDF